MKTRTLIIGDIHGAYRALQQVLERAAVTASDRLIFLGDYVDGWSETKQVIDRLIQLEQSNPCIFIRGNHDTWCEQWLADGSINAVWAEHGGRETMKSYEGIDAAAKEAHLHFFDRLQNYYIDAQNNLFIHAGFSSMHGPSRETHLSNFSWDRTLWETALALDNRIPQADPTYPKRLKLFTEIFIGHTPTIDYHKTTPVQAANLWNVDTGAAFYGKLSAMDIGSKEYWQSDPVRELYPDEKGRNRA